MDAEMSREELIAANPHLTPKGYGQDSLRLGAKNLRADLKHAGITASVRLSRFAGGDSLGVNVLEPEKVDQAREIASRYAEYGSTINPWTAVFGGATYSYAQEARFDDREKLLGTYKPPPKKELTRQEKLSKFYTGAERGTASTLAKYIDEFKEDKETMEMVWWVATKKAMKTGSDQGALRVLVEQGGMDPNHPTGVRNTSALHLVVKAPEVVKVMLDAGADPNAVIGDGRTPLHIAAQFNRVESIEALVEAGADPNFQDKFGRTPLILTDKGEEGLATVRALLDAGADPNIARKDGETALFRVDSGEVAQALVDAGGDPSIKDSLGQTPDEWSAVPGKFPSRVPDEVKSVYRQKMLSQIAQANRPEQTFRASQEEDLATPEQALAARQARYGRAM